MPRRPRLATRRSTSVLAAVLLLSACDAGVLPSSVPVTVPVAIDATAWAGAVCQAADQLALAAGDPNTGERSPAWSAFETALTTGDEETIDDAANAVLGHLTQGARAAREAQGFEPGRAAAGEWLALLDGLATGVRTLRDGTIQQDAERINEGRALLDAAYEAHFEQATGQMRAVPLAGAPLPCA